MEWIPGPPCKRLELDSLIQSSGYPRKWAWLGEGRAMCPNHTAYTQGQGCPPCHLPTPCHITSGLTPSSNASEQRLRENLGEMLRVSHDREASSDRMFCRLMKFSHFSLKKHSFFQSSYSFSCRMKPDLFFFFQGKWGKAADTETGSRTIRW